MTLIVDFVSKSEAFSHFCGSNRENCHKKIHQAASQGTTVATVQGPRPAMAVGATSPVIQRYRDYNHNLQQRRLLTEAVRYCNL